MGAADSMLVTQDEAHQTVFGQAAGQRSSTRHTIELPEVARLKLDPGLETVSEAYDWQAAVTGSQLQRTFHDGPNADSDAAAVADRAELEVQMRRAFDDEAEVDSENEDDCDASLDQDSEDDQAAPVLDQEWLDQHDVTERDPLIEKPYDRRTARDWTADARQAFDRDDLSIVRACSLTDPSVERPRLRWRIGGKCKPRMSFRGMLPC